MVTGDGGGVGRGMTAEEVTFDPFEEQWGIEGRGLATEILDIVWARTSSKRPEVGSGRGIRINEALRGWLERYPSTSVLGARSTPYVIVNIGDLSRACGGTAARCPARSRSARSILMSSMNRGSCPSRHRCRGIVVISASFCAPAAACPRSQRPACQRQTTIFSRPCTQNRRQVDELSAEADVR